MLKTEELLKYGIAGTVSTKQYEYNTPEEIVVRTNGIPTNLISTYNDENGRPTMVLYKDINSNMRSKHNAKFAVTRKKVYRYYGPDECIVECSDYRDGELCSVETTDIISDDRSVHTIEDMKNESTKMFINNTDTRIFKVRSKEENMNKTIKILKGGSTFTRIVYKYTMGDQLLFMYIGIWSDIDDKPIRVVQKLHDSKFNRISCMEATTSEELSNIPWLNYSNEELVKETEPNQLISGRIYKNKNTGNYHAIYEIAGPATICEEIVTEGNMVLNMTVDMGVYEYNISPYTMPGSGIYSVSFYKNNENNEIEESVIMLVKSEVIEELVGKIFAEMCNDCLEYFME